MSNPSNAWHLYKLLPVQAGQAGVPGIAANDTVWPSGHAGNSAPIAPAVAADTRRSGTGTAMLVSRWSFEVPEPSAIDPRPARPSAQSVGTEQTPERHSILSALQRFLAEWRIRDADRRCMSVLDDRILTDIGFTRDDANRPVWQPFGRS